MSHAPPQPLRAYVSIRGSRSPRRVDRDASPAHTVPYASLLIHDRDGRAHRFELGYAVLSNGTVIVQLRRAVEGEMPALEEIALVHA